MASLGQFCVSLCIVFTLSFAVASITDILSIDSLLDNIGSNSGPSTDEGNWTISGYDLDITVRSLDHANQILRNEIQENLSEFLKKGFENAQKILEKENEEIQQRGEVMTPPGFHFRKTSMKTKQASACYGLGMLETSELVAKSYNLSNDMAYEILRSVSVSPSDVRIKSELCETHEQSTRVQSSITCNVDYPYRSISGVCNNLNVDRIFDGSAGTSFKRYLFPDYGNGVSTMRGNGHLPNPREVSFSLSQLPARGHSIYMTQMLKAWGQFIDHDITLTAENAGSTDSNNDGHPDPIPCCDGSISTHPDCVPIEVFSDPFYRRFGVDCLRFVRSLIAPRGNTLGTREQVNGVTSFLDGSNIYGSDEDTALDLRAKEGGRMRVNDKHEDSSCHPINICNLSYLPQKSSKISDFFYAGDIRVNEQPGITAMHTLFIRYHNMLAKNYEILHPGSSDEHIYQESRRYVVAVIQHITYNEFVPLVVGRNATIAYELNSNKEGYLDTYKEWIDPSIANVFATAAFRFGHTLVGSNIIGASKWKPLSNCFFDNKFMLDDHQLSPSEVVKGECTSPSEHSDVMLIDTLTNKLFAQGPHYEQGTDLLSLNIMRGRDHGLPSYNEWRIFCRKRPFGSFKEMRSEIDSAAVDVFQALYRSVDDVDFYPAGIAEHHIPYGFLGDTFACILSYQFHELKYADRFWYENNIQPKPFTLDQLKAIRNMTLAKLLCSTTSSKHFQSIPMVNSQLTGNTQVDCEKILLEDPLWMQM